MSELITVMIGVDEVGRGAVYGPLVVAAAAPVPGSARIVGIKDSKRIKSEERRNELFRELQTCTYYTVGTASAQFINARGIGSALIVATARAYGGLLRLMRVSHPEARFEVMLDGNGWEALIVDATERHPYATFRSEEKADDRYYHVSAASIIAKVTRDNWVRDRVAADPDLSKYHLVGSKGYGTPPHKAALLQYGLTSDHRKRFCETLMRPKEKENVRTNTNAAQLPLF